jgi:hypothetical protein
VKFLTKFLILIAASMLIQIAHAEGGCPEGMAPYASPNGPGIMCTPIPGYNQQSQPQQPSLPPARWADQWGAIVTDNPHGIVGSAKEMSNEADAKRSAYASCKAKRGDDCKLRLTYKNGCAVFVAGDKVSNGASDATLTGAKTLAIQTCEKTGDKNCEVVYSGCSMPVRIQ